MTLPLPARAEDQEAQRSLDQIARQFPLSARHLATNAATKLHTTAATTSGPTTTSTADPMTAVIPEMTITADFGGNPVVVLFTGSFTHTVGGVGEAVEVQAFDAGTALGERRVARITSSGGQTLALLHAYTPATGSRTIEIRWRTSAATATATALRRQLAIVELRR